ncbi:Hypp3370 [Branchiostoma lanceolatum]|uniref:Hypp3370 protein n=1 Tax=Branchiostoma lanceolatum TaxID=7740 RepID=A0A8K0A1Y3_BRALA|nr:Hypp3370 [Branchiostoma lanceolatum]
MLLLHVGPLALPPTKTETCRKKFGRPAGDVTVDSRSGDLTSWLSLPGDDVSSAAWNSVLPPDLQTSKAGGAKDLRI